MRRLNVCIGNSKPGVPPRGSDSCGRCAGPESAVFVDVDANAGDRAPAGVPKAADAGLEVGSVWNVGLPAADAKLWERPAGGVVPSTAVDAVDAPVPCGRGSTCGQMELPSADATAWGAAVGGGGAAFLEVALSMVSPFAAKAMLMAPSGRITKTGSSGLSGSHSWSTTAVSSAQGFELSRYLCSAFWGLINVWFVDVLLNKTTRELDGLPHNVNAFLCRPQKTFISHRTVRPFQFVV
jgi:hypothetical protein